MGTYDTQHGAPLSPDWNDPAPSELVEAVLSLLEDANIPTATNDAIVKLIEGAEQESAEIQRVTDALCMNTMNLYELRELIDRGDRCGADPRDVLIAKAAAKFLDPILGTRGID